MTLCELHSLLFCSIKKDEARIDFVWPMPDITHWPSLALGYLHLLSEKFPCQLYGFVEGRRLSWNCDEEVYGSFEYISARLYASFL